jgi:hypothetical protein
LDSNHALRKDLELFAKELTKEKFQALSPGLGLGVLRNVSSASNEKVSSPIMSSSRLSSPRISLSVPAEDKSQSYSAINLASQKAIAHKIYNRTPWWAFVLAHVADLLVAALFVVTCIIGFNMMNPEAPLNGVGFGSLRLLSTLYLAFILYLGIFKLLGLNMLGRLVRQSFSAPPKELENQEM